MLLTFVLARVFVEGADARRPRHGVIPIAVKLDDLLHDRRMTLTELAERVRITIVNLSILKTGAPARSARPSTICAALACQPGDVLEFLPDAAAAGPRAAWEI